jgi:hypothetical protein
MRGGAVRSDSNDDAADRIIEDGVALGAGNPTFAQYRRGGPEHLKRVRNK